MCLSCTCPFPIWCLWQSAEFDCIGSWPLPFYLLQNLSEFCSTQCLQNKLMEINQMCIYFDNIFHQIPLIKYRVIALIDIKTHHQNFVSAQYIFGAYWVFDQFGSVCSLVFKWFIRCHIDRFVKKKYRVKIPRFCQTTTELRSPTGWSIENNWMCDVGLEFVVGNSLHLEYRT